MYKSILIFLAVVIVQASAITVTNCITNASDTTSVTISGCDSVPCKMVIGVTTDITLKFTPNQDVTSLTNLVSIVYMGTSKPHTDVDGTSACNNIQVAIGNTVVTCPLDEGTEYIYKNGLQIPVGHPTVIATLRLALESNSVNQACFEVPVEIVSA